MPYKLKTDFLGMEYPCFLNKVIPLFITEIFSFKCMSKFHFESNTRTMNTFSNESEIRMNNFNFCLYF